MALSEPENLLPNVEWEGYSPVSGVDKAFADLTARGARNVRQPPSVQNARICCGFIRT
jgi:hypothetical protein